ncbi:MAG: hypothetical protein WAX12_07005 [Candidatus Microthrix subdominans]|jgi:hypothetical protein
MIELGLVGAIIPVEGGLHPAPGFLLVILRNGKPKMVVLTGKKYRGMFRAAHMEALPVRTGSVQIEDLNVTHVVLEDGHRLPNVSVTATILLNPARDYQHLLQRVERDGPFFAQNLGTEVSQAIDQLVRTTLEPNTHAELHGRNLTGIFGAGQELLGGLFLLESISKVDPSWDEAFVAVNREQRAAATQEEEDRNLHARAERLGVRAIDLANPDMFLETLRGMTALEVERVRQDGALTQAIVENIRQVSRSPEDLKRFIGVRDLLDLPQAPVGQTALPNANKRLDAERTMHPNGASIPGDWPPAGAGSQHGPASGVPRGEAATHRPQVSNLGCPAAVAMLWESLGLADDDLVGAAVHQTLSGFRVVAVVDASPSTADLARFAEMIAAAYGLDASPTISVVSFHRYFDRLISRICAELFGQGHQTTNSSAWRFDSDSSDVLRITLLLPDPSQLRRVRAEVLDPETGLKNVLSCLLEGQNLELAVAAAE